VFSTDNRSISSNTEWIQLQSTIRVWTVNRRVEGWATLCGYDHLRRLHIWMIRVPGCTQAHRPEYYVIRTFSILLLDASDYKIRALIACLSVSTGRIFVKFHIGHYDNVDKIKIWVKPNKILGTLDELVPAFCVCRECKIAIWALTPTCMATKQN